MAAAGYDEATLDASRLAAVEAREAAVETAIQSGDSAAAVAAALDNPPLGTKDAGIKARNAAVVLRAMAAVKDADIDGIVAAMSPDEADTCMKYVYKGLESNNTTAISGSLFKWHAQLVEKSGLGCIVRTMTDRKTV
uniref:Actin-related protein 2/3 complex subunit 5 n=1 Tax=Bicosoecida sp. CB-2014 TaxID=1486930 RepID=A0A7S1C9L8_9STRA